MRIATPFEDILAGARFAVGLPAFFRHRLTQDEARATLQLRLEHREENFLAMIRAEIFEHPRSPYAALLKAAGCEYGDLEALVASVGLEDALRALLQKGIYLTAEELKGRQPIRRGSLMIDLTPADLRNPAARRHYQNVSSGSRGAPTSVWIDLAETREQAVNHRLYLWVRGGLGWTHAVWGVPGGATMNLIQYLLVSGLNVTRWFSQVDPTAHRVHPRYRWSARVLRLSARLAGVDVPAPEHVSVDDPGPIVRWMRELLEAGETPHLWTYASSAVRVCLAAREAGVDLRGAEMSMSGEPTTASRLEAVRKSGAVAVPRSGTTETGTFGFGCLAPTTVDEQHLMNDLLAVIQPTSPSLSDNLAGEELLITSLCPTARLVLLNASLGDQAVLTRRDCGCPLQRLGWTQHFHTMRSRDRLTTGGMAFLDADVQRILDDILPARFGGEPTDYQLVEDEDEHGMPRLSILARPALGPLDEPTVVGTFLDSVASGRGAAHVMALQWRQAGLLRVIRREPFSTTSGKILHMHESTGQTSVS